MSKKQTNWSEVLQRGSAAKIQAELKNKVSLRTIQRVLALESEDYYGILEIAARMGKEHLKRKKKAKSTLVLLKLSKVSLLKQK